MIDLGISTLAHSQPPVDMTSTEIEYARRQLGLDVLPVVLGGTAHWDSTTDYEAAMRSAATSLADRDLVADGEIYHGLGIQLRALTRPSWELALRSHNNGVLTRVCIAADESLCTEVTFDTEHSTYTLRGGVDPADSVQRALGPSAAMDIAVVNAPTEALSIAFNAGPDVDTITAALITAGVPSIEAAQLGSAIAGCTSFTEIVGIPHALGSANVLAGIVTVYNTAYGRLVASSSTSADGTAWSSISSGSPTRLRQSINALVELMTDSITPPCR